MADGHDPKPLGPNTQLAHSGNNPRDYFGWVNPPVVRGSTVLFPDAATMKASRERPAAANGRSRIQPYTYATYGTPTTDALCAAVDALEGSAGTILVPSGLAAVTVPLLAFLSAGDHVLIVDTVYHPTRRFADTMLARLGVEVDYYAPERGADIADLFRPNTRVLFIEAPGSNTFEMQDVPALAAAARARGVVTMIDNTWATPLFFRPLDHGVDISTQAATKYLCGHSDVMLGSIAVNDEELFRTHKDTAIQFGNSVSPADCYLALRGMRTMGVRLRQHQATALRLIEWLSGRPEVERCLYPAWPDDPGHAIWKRDFQGASGLFGVVLRPAGREAVAALVDGMRYFRIGASWGGYESLMIPAYPTRDFAEPPWSERGPLLRLHAGLEDSRDLIADLEEGFARFRQAAEAEA